MSPSSYPSFQLIPLPSGRDAGMQMKQREYKTGGGGRQESRERKKKRGDRSVQAWHQQLSNTDRQAVRQGQLRATLTFKHTNRGTMDRRWSITPLNSPLTQLSFPQRVNCFSSIKPQLLPADLFLCFVLILSSHLLSPSHFSRLAALPGLLPR